MRILAPDELADWAARIQRMAASGDGPEAYYGFAQGGGGAGASISGAKLLDGSVPPSVPTEPTTPDLIMDLSRARVSITSAFQGESILLFGMFDPPGEIVVVVAGPPARETVMRKQRFLGIWLNTGRQAFDDVPAYYAIASSRPLDKIVDDKTADRKSVV